MPKLLRAPTGLLNAILPSDVKQAAVDYFLQLTKSISASQFSGMVAVDISLWKDCIPGELQEIMLDGAKDTMTKMWVKMVSDQNILDWVLESRPDLKEIFSSYKGKVWFLKQVNQIKQELGV